MGKGTSMALTHGRKFDAFLDRLFYCPACTTWRLPGKLQQKRLASQTGKRNASTATSSTAINATKIIPKAYEPLYEALQDIRKDAAAHVNTSRLQLALQGLESRNPTIRLAILGLNVSDIALKIARLLQADPLEDQGQWESQLAEGREDYSNGLIIRYGHAGNSNIPRPRNSVPVLYVPAQILEKHNIEILVSSVNSMASEDYQTPRTIPSDVFLAPNVGVPTSFDGRHTMVSQPVHKCLMVVRGLDELLIASQLLAAAKFNSTEDRNSINIAVQLNNVQLPVSESKVYLVNTRKAEEGLAAIRESVSRATEYEHKWIDAGMLELSRWVDSSADVRSDSNATLRQPIETLVSAVLKAADHSIETARTYTTIPNQDSVFSVAAKTNLDLAIEEFSRSAHQELQSGLASAWSSRNWRKLAWYKLFWRVDDVGLIISDLVTNAWLPKTERAIYELSGRLVQVGISPVMKEIISAQPVEQLQTTTVPSTDPALEPAAQLATAALEAPQTEPVITTLPSSQAAVQLRPIPRPLPITSTISQRRSTYMLNSITELTTTAQQLVLRTLSITGLTAGLSSLSYFSSLSGTVYEAGTIAAVGTVFALWTMQGGWMKATKRLEDGLFAEGRSVIIDVVDRMKNLVETKARSPVDVAAINEYEKAKSLVARARTELDNLVSEKTKTS